jgi:hypothetical protein
MLVTYCLETADGSKTKPQKYWNKLSDDLEELSQPAGMRKQRSFATAWRMERKTPHSPLEPFIKTALFLKGFFCA